MPEQNSASRHGIFISYKRTRKDLAWVIYEYFKNKGFDPFIDTVTLLPEKHFPEKIRQEIQNAPYFFCLLTKDGLDDLRRPASTKDNMFRMEVEEAIKQDKEILIFRDALVTYEDMNKLDQPLSTALTDVNSRIIPDYLDELLFTLDYFCRYISLDKLDGVINWREYTAWNTNVCCMPRQMLEKTVASFDHRFGKEFMDCVKSGEDYHGEYKVKEINMSCYAANIIFTPSQEMIDRKAYDLGLMFNTFSALLKDPDFNLRLVINAPKSPGAKDAIKYRKLGNSAFEDDYNGVFLSSFAQILKLVEEEPFKSAKARHRFSYVLSECAMPYAIFNVVYKNGWEEFNHTKIDLYSLDLDSNVDRRSMIIFEKDDKTNYDFFVHQFNYLRREEFRKRSKQLIRSKKEQWMAEWEKILHPQEEE